MSTDYFVLGLNLENLYIPVKPSFSNTVLRGCQFRGHISPYKSRTTNIQILKSS